MSADPYIQDLEAASLAGRAPEKPSDALPPVDDQLLELRQLTARAVWNRVGGRAANLPPDLVRVLKDNLWSRLCALAPADLEVVLTACNSLASGELAVRRLAKYPHLQQMANYILSVAEKSFTPGGAFLPLEPFSDGELGDTLDRATARFGATRDGSPAQFSAAGGTLARPAAVSAAQAAVARHYGPNTPVIARGGPASDDDEDEDDFANELDAAILRSLTEM